MKKELEDRKVIQVRLDDSLVDDFNLIWQNSGLKSKSEVVRDLIKKTSQSIRRKRIKQAF